MNQHNPTGEPGPMRLSKGRLATAVISHLCLPPGVGHVILGLPRRGVCWFAVGNLLAWSLPSTGLLGLVSALLLIPACMADVLVTGRRRGLAVPWRNVVPLAVALWAIGWGSGKLLRAYRVESFHVPSASMSPTLVSGDHFLVNKSGFGGRQNPSTPFRGDVIVFRRPGAEQHDFVMRAVALPGEAVAVRDGRLHINGAAVEATLVALPCPPGALGGDADSVECIRLREQVDGANYEVLRMPQDSRGDFPSASVPCSTGTSHSSAPEGCVVPAGHVFVLGDNRDNSFDSRFWGPVPLDSIKGKAAFIHFSFASGEGVRWQRSGRVHQDQ